ncbi:stress enhanced protein 2, chloroplastic [Malania oleifera]|uniref:stress enhanced protein 2, chloroplastic n=1 Tax=Malania oleifera TaxID=397392 RepID=UPI0025ADF395|nr:stress enhanced protein 2, chloroplastic [Malania oleifera]
MATAARAIFSELRAQKPATPVQRSRSAESPPENVKIVLQPRLCTLRSYGSEPAGVVRKRRDGDAGDGVSPFFATLSEYIESSKESQDFEIISGRLAMIIFAATMTMEVATGNTLFRKMDLQGIAEAGGVCVGAVTCAAIFAWFSTARNRVGRIFTVSCNTFFDSLIDQIIDGLFYEGELSDWSDEL